MSILITGFEPFGGDSENPSRLSARAAVALLKADGHDAHFLEVPCVFATAFPTVEAEAKRVGAEIVIAAGLAAGRRVISLESTAKNIIDARIPDNAGGQPRDVPVVPGGPKTLPTRLPIARAAEAIKAFEPADEPDFKPIPVAISDDAVGLEEQAIALAIVAKEALATRIRTRLASSKCRGA
ncbi:hypothetical protein CcaverHIS002_0601910 [Cutaneotrichosporon cavernicola]|nr:hypothetical protein CcaverHIS002_0601910 [Cutaneotrichosporon cavernicola]